MWERTNLSQEQLRDLESQGASKEEIEQKKKELMETALQEGSLYRAIKAAIELNNRERVKQIAERCISESYLHDAHKGFSFLGDREGMLRVIEAQGREGNTYGVEWAVGDYLQVRSENGLYERFHNWANQKNVRRSICFDVSTIANMAYHLAGNYDFGVGIASGGLFSTFIFENFGLETMVAECHRRGKGATFEWHSGSKPELLMGKNIIVFDKDVVTGRTTRRFLREIQRYQPKSVDLALVHNPICSAYGLGTIAENIPPGFRQVYFPSSFNYNFIVKAVKKLEQSLGNGRE